MWLKEPFVTSIRCHYGSQHPTSPSAGIRARQTHVRSAHAHPGHPLSPAVAPQPPLEDIYCCLLTTQCLEGACEMARRIQELAADPNSRAHVMEGGD